LLGPLSLLYHREGTCKRIYVKIAGFSSATAPLPPSAQSLVAVPASAWRLAQAHPLVRLAYLAPRRAGPCQP